MEVNFQKLNKAQMVCSKELELNEVSRIFKGEVETLQENMETLRPLLDPAMGETQWELVTSIVRAVTEDDTVFEDLQDPKYTYNFLVDMELKDMRDQFSEIALHASKEAELVKMMDNVELFWKD